MIFISGNKHPHKKCKRPIAKIHKKKKRTEKYDFNAASRTILLTRLWQAGLLFVLWSVPTCNYHWYPIAKIDINSIQVAKIFICQ